MRRDQRCVRVDGLGGPCESTFSMEGSERVDADKRRNDQRLVAKKTAYLFLGQVLVLPISVLMSGMIGRFFGPAEMGGIYLAVSMCGFGILAVEWGQQGALPALIARDRSQAGALLGSGFAWRAV